MTSIPVTNTRTKKILRFALIMTWIVFIALMVQTGALLVTYGVTIFNPQAEKHMYLGHELYAISIYSFDHYTLAVFFTTAILAMKAFIAYIVIRDLSEVKMENPFTTDTAWTLEWISYILLGITFLAIFTNLQAAWLLKNMGVPIPNAPVEEYVFVTVIVYVISLVFKRGVELIAEKKAL
jgi:hypothetical protein